VKTFKRRQPPQAFLASVARYIAALIAEHRPSALAIEQTLSVQREAALLKVTAAEIKHTAKQLGLAVYEFDPAQVRRLICQGEKSTKLETAQIIAGRYPELSRLLRQPTRWEMLYWAHVFDAVAVGLVCWRQI